MSQILVKIDKDKDGKFEVTMGVALQMKGQFKGGAVEQLGRRKMGRNFIEGICKQLVKEIGPQLQNALKEEFYNYEHPDQKPKAPENPGAAPEGPVLHPALSGGNGRGQDNPGVQGADQEPDNGD